ncbi:MAG: carbohydrate ABC transporter permease [Clostridia bacterium]|nr:carbohydrate ABC transporter permease [Clostridia bacterium]
MKRKISFEDKAVTALSYIFMLMLAAVIVIPVLNLMAKAVSSSTAVTSGKVTVFPIGFQLDTLKSVIVSEKFTSAAGNSVFVTLIGTLIALFVNALTAYPLSKKNLSCMKAIMMIFVFTMLFSGGLIPTYLLIKNLGLYNKRWALILPTAINVYNMLIIKNYYESIPDSIEESVKIDGAGNFMIFIKFMLPLSKPVLATICLFTMVAYWNDYFSALMYIDKPALKTLQLYMSEVILEAQQDVDTATLDDLMNISGESVRCATIIAATVPIVIIYPFLQKYFIKGIMIGSVKG